jgi:hypothetical protein
MLYSVEADQSTIRNEGEPGCKSTYRYLREMFRLPTFEIMARGLAGDFSSLMAWTGDAHVNVMPFTFEHDKRIKIDLVLKTENIVVGTMWYGASNIISATFNRTRDAKDILEMFYQHWMISYKALGSEDARLSIREIVATL